MALMAWSSCFVTGIDSIDSQHRMLVDLTNAVAPHLAAAGDEPARNVRPLLDHLADYAATHFRHEEALMQIGGIDATYVARHRQAHAEFVQDISQMIRDSETENRISGKDLLRFLTSWLTFHILSEDQNMARQLITGLTAENQTALCETNEQAERSATTALTGALIDLFSLVSQRNQTLRLVNEQLGTTKSALAEANEQLELRVRERTEDLKQANDKLEREHKALIESLTQTRLAQARLLQSEKMAAIGQLAAGVAHEMNNPISFVASNFNTLGAYTERLFALVNTLQEQVRPLPCDHPVRSAMEASCERAELEFLRHDIPDLLRESSHGLARVTRIVADLKDGLESVLNLMSGQFAMRISIVREFGALPVVRCIPAQINQVFMNLLLNAAQAIDDAGVITIRTYQEKGNVRIDISDNGHGIPDEIRKRVFEPFFTTRPIGNGTGLGLSVAWDIIKNHDGHLGITSRVGAGTTLSISLPVERRPIAEGIPT
jgi:hemerythrin-like metal-binding protein